MQSPASFCVVLDASARTNCYGALQLVYYFPSVRAGVFIPRVIRILNKYFSSCVRPATSVKVKYNKPHAVHNADVSLVLYRNRYLTMSRRGFRVEWYCFIRCRLWIKTLVLPGGQVCVFVMSVEDPFKLLTSTWSLHPPTQSIKLYDIFLDLVVVMLIHFVLSMPFVHGPQQGPYMRQEQ